MRTRAGRLLGVGAIVVSLAIAGSGAAQADTVLSSSSGGGQTCYDYIDAHGHIYTVCNAPEPSMHESLATDGGAASTGHTHLLARFNSPIR